MLIMIKFLFLTIFVYEIKAANDINVKVERHFPCSANSGKKNEYFNKNFLIKFKRTFFRSK